MNEIILNCQDVVKTFDDGPLHVEVLKQIDLTLLRGEQIAIVGASGSGKTTLLHILGGLEKPTSGQVFVEGEALESLPDSKIARLRNQSLGYIYQFHHLLPEFTALENVAMPALLGGLSVKAAEEKARALLSKVDLSHREQHKLAQLSGGERQRTAIARALVNDPACVLADEPTGNLDGATAEKVYETLLELNRELQTSIVLVTHDLSLARRMDKVYRIEAGQLNLTERD